MQKKPTYDELEQKCNALEHMEKEQVKHQKKLLIDRRREAIETLAGGIAHKFNNALSGIIGNIELLKMEAVSCNKVDKYTDRMMAAAQKMTDLASQLLAYAEGGKYKAVPLSLSDSIENTISNISHTFSPHIQFKTETPRDINKINGDPVQIQILLSAIIENAAEAIKGKGRIWIIAQNKEVDMAFVKEHPGLSTGSYIYLRIIDDGIGMDKNTKRRIFDPFFTTNFQGRGLGMAAVWGIVKSHHGWIYIDSEPGKGTCTSIFLPAITVQKKRMIEPDLATSTNIGTILLIEDEKIVQDVERAMMEKLGYNVLTAQCGSDALNIAKTYKGNIDLVFLDLGLPGMGGQELYPLLMLIRPDLKVIICSGQSIDGIAQNLLDSGAQGFIQKPFGFSELAPILKDNIDRRKYKRLNLDKGAIAKPLANFSQQVKIINISKGGMAFCYKEKNKQLNSPTEQSINILVDDYNLCDIPYRTISDSPLAETSSFKPEWMGRCSIQFIDLTPDHAKQLDSLIKNQTNAYF